MSNLIKLHHEERVREEASIWVVRLKDGLTEQQECDLTAWLDKDDSHRTALVEIATAWDELDIIEQLSSPAPAVTVRDKTHSAKWKKLALAATLLICLFAGWMLYHGLSTNTAQLVDETAQNIAPIYETAVGEQSKISLPDGSTTSLNTNSKIKVEFSTTERKIDLTKGEALFEVKSDATRPFVVTAGKTTIRAVGTAFNILRTEQNSLEVLVSEGRVAVISPAKENLFSGIIRKRHSAVELTAGEIVKIKGEKKEHVRKLDDKKMHTRLAWTTGMIVFDDQPLEQAIAELSRYTETKLVISDHRLRRINVAGYFRVGDIDGLLYALSENFDIAWEQQEENLIVLKHR